MQRALRLPIGLMVLVLAAFAVSTAAAGGAKPKQDGTPRFGTQGQVAPDLLASATTVPHWTFRYTDPSNGATYPITMVGADPRTNASTTVQAVIVPLKLSFVADKQDTSLLDDFGYVGFRAAALSRTFDASRRAQDLLASPIFDNAALPRDLGGDTAQYGDAFMRAQFGKLGSGYHVRLSGSVLPTQTIDVPATKGLAYQRPVGAWRTANGMPTDTVTGVVQEDWFSARLQHLLGTLDLSPTAVPIFVTDNVLLYRSDYLDCCTIGFHGTGAAQGNGTERVQTYIFAAWLDPGTYSGFMTDFTGTRTAPRPQRGFADIHSVSHEVAEWLADPFLSNAVAPWFAPTAPAYGCTGLLETGDPVVGVWFPLAGNTAGAWDGRNYGRQYHPEDELFTQWFGHGGVEATGLRSWDGRLNLMGNRTTSIPGYESLAGYSHGC